MAKKSKRAIFEDNKPFEIFRTRLEDKGVSVSVARTLEGQDGGAPCAYLRCGMNWLPRRVNATKKPWAVIDPNGPCGDEIVAGAIETKEKATLFAAAPDPLGTARLFALSIEYEIRRDKKNGDDEGSRLKTATLNMVRATIAKATGETP